MKDCMYNLDDISSFLHFGYLVKYHSDFESHILPENNLSELQRNIQIEVKDESVIIEKGMQALKASFNNIKGGLHIVPLSGGLDSRTILAGLIDTGIKDRIITVTFGSSGTWDYELGSGLAQKIGLRHVNLDLTKIEVKQGLLLETAQNGSAWTFLIDAFYNSLICKEFGRDVTYWSGFMGGELAGAHLPPSESLSWLEAKKNFVNWNRYARSIILTPPGFNPEKSLPSSPLIDRSIMSYDDQLDFVFRQQNYIKRIVMFNGYHYKTPFLANKWVDFILSIPRCYRVNKYIYKKIVTRAYPELFSFPTANTFGGTLNISQGQLKFRRILSGVRNRIASSSFCGALVFNSVWDFLIIFRNLN